MSVTTDKEVTFVSTSMGRLAYLRRTLPVYAAQAGCRTVLVDYTCPDGSAAWAREQLPDVTVVEERAQTTFNLSRARNIGFREVSTRWVCFVDADTLVAPDFLEKMRPALVEGAAFRGAVGGDDGAPDGTLLVESALFRQTGGYDERSAAGATRTTTSTPRSRRQAAPCAFFRRRSCPRSSIRPRSGRRTIETASSLRSFATAFTSP